MDQIASIGARLYTQFFQTGRIVELSCAIIAIVLKQQNCRNKQSYKRNSVKNLYIYTILGHWS